MTEEKKAKPAKRFYNKEETDFQEEEYDEILRKLSDESSEAENIKKHGKAKKKVKTEAAWVDKHDEQIEVDLTSVARLRKLRKNNDEKKVSGIEYQERLQEFYNEKLFQTDFFKWGREAQTLDEGVSYLDKLMQNDLDIYNAKEEISPEVIQIEKIGSLMSQDRHKAVVQTIDFHPNSDLMLTGAYDRMIKIFSINQNERFHRDRIKPLKSIFTEGLPISKAQFLPQYNQVFASGLKKYMLAVDLEKENVEKISSHLFASKFNKKIERFSANDEYITLLSDEGYIVVLSAKTKQYLFELKMNEKCLDAKFSGQNQLFSVGEGGRIYQWDLRNRKIINCFNDVGSSVTNTIDISGKMLATGSSCGIVNLYEMAGTELTHVKEIQNLTTSVNNCRFNANSEIMALSTRWKKNGIRLFNVKEKKVYKNWPNLKTNVNFITTLEVSRDNKFLAIGNDLGSVHLYNFVHYN